MGNEIEWFVIRDDKSCPFCTFCEIDTFLTFQKNSRMPMTIAMLTPVAKTMNTPPTFCMSNSGVSTFVSFSLVQFTGSPSLYLMLFVIHHFSFRCCTVRSSFSNKIASLISSRNGESEERKLNEKWSQNNRKKMNFVRIHTHRHSNSICLWI